MGDNLWGDLTGLETGPTAPVAILREQASLLNTATKGLVTAFVIPEGGWGPIGYKFVLRAPALNNYTFDILAIGHGPQMYPLRLSPLTGGEPAVDCPNEGAFKIEVGRLLADGKLKDIVRGLIAQSNALIQ